MSEGEFEEFIATTIPEYAADKVTAGQWPEEQSLELSRQAILDLLPQGLLTPDNLFFTVLDEDEKPVGTLWIATWEQAGEHIAYVYDLRIRPECRRLGHATRALSAAEDEARRLGLSGIGLHVFGHNAAGRALYEKRGYRPTNISMFKPLRREPTKGRRRTVR